MIHIKEAKEKVLDSVWQAKIEYVRIEKAVHRILAKDIYADREFPPFNRVAMDGIAIQFETYQKGQRSFPIQSICAAGSPQQILEDDQSCIEIMTGASLPIHCDTVIRYEDLVREKNTFKIQSTVKQGQNIHQKGSDHPLEEKLLLQNSEIKPIDINVLASIGLTKVPVWSLPKVVVIATGNELVDLSQKPLPHQIRKSNVYMLAAGLQEYQIEAPIIHLNDEKSILEEKLDELSQKYDVLIMSGGVSKGKYDYIPEILDKIGIKKQFHRVAQRPGKPIWFGRSESCVVFAFPGNPVSTLACFHVYFIPWLRKLLHQKDDYSFPVKLEKDVVFKPSLSYFAEAVIHIHSDGTRSAEVIKGNGSGDLVNPTKMDGFVILEEGKDLYKKGEIHSFVPYSKRY